MMKFLLASCSFAMILALGSSPLRAQAPASNPAPATSPSPQASPQASNISPDELKKFAGAIKKMVAIAQETETQMAQTVQASKIPDERFREIYQSKRDPQAKPKTPITADEQQRYEQTVSKLTQIETDARKRMDAAITEQQLERQRFDQIFAAVQGNPQLRQEVKNIIQNPQGR